MFTLPTERAGLLRGQNAPERKDYIMDRVGMPVEE